MNDDDNIIAALKAEVDLLKAAWNSDVVLSDKRAAERDAARADAARLAEALRLAEAFIGRLRNESDPDLDALMGIGLDAECVEAESAVRAALAAHDAGEKGDGT